MGKKVYLVTYNGFLDSYGELIYTAGVYASEEKAQEALDKIRKKLVETVRDPDIQTYMTEEVATKQGKITPVFLDRELIPDFKWWDEELEDYDSWHSPSPEYDDLCLGGFCE